MKVRTVKLKQVVGNLYIPDNKPLLGIILARGGPSIGDNGKSPFSETCNRNQTLLFVPDYIGYCRSGGSFNFRNCIKTFTESNDFLQGKVSGIDINTGEKIVLNLKKVVLVGSSWGGSMVPFISKYKVNNIKHIGLIKAVTDWKTQGKTKHLEEDVRVTHENIVKYWKKIYRNYVNSEWSMIFLHAKSEYNPINNIGLIKDKNIYLVHGKKDKTVHWSKTAIYEKSLKKEGVSVVSNYIKHGKHDDETTNIGLEFIISSVNKVSI